jgi:FtsZ-binding cell division protein ZapB
MSLGLHETRQRRSRRFRWALTKWVIALGAIATAGVFAYRTGTGLAERKVTTLSREIVTLSDKAAALQQQNTELRANEILLEERLRDAQLRYEKDVPAGRMAALLGQMQDKLDKGVEMARLEFLIASADNPRECETVPATKRFLVQTPLYSGANDSVSYAKGTITVTAQGESAVSAAGQVEAWYDPAKPVTARFTAIGGRVKSESGTLPIYATVVEGDYEYRFTMVAAGTRGFVQVTGDRCKYP